MIIVCYVMKKIPYTIKTSIAFVKTKTNISFIIPVVIIVGTFIFGLFADLLKNETFISYFEIIIDVLFLFFVLKEFKMTRKSFEMTRKSFEWMEEEQQERKDKEASKQLTEIVKFFAYQFLKQNVRFGYESRIDRENSHGQCKSIEEVERKAEYFFPENDEWINFLLKRYKDETKKDVNEQEKFAINEINKKFFNLYQDINITNNTSLNLNKEYAHCTDEAKKSIDHICLFPDTAKHMGIDYKILEKIYNNIIYKDYDDQKTH